MKKEQIPSPLYYGNSMAGVFVPGDRLELEPVVFDRLRPGDVVAIQEGPLPYVHRVIRIRNGAATTMGDNNLRPDRRPLTPESNFALVVAAVGPDGRSRPIPGGRVGRRWFRRHQRRRQLRALGAACWKWLEPVAWWRIPVRGRIGFRDEVVFEFHGLPVARRVAGGPVRYYSIPRRLLFRVVEPRKRSGE